MLAQTFFVTPVFAALASAAFLAKPVTNSGNVTAVNHAAPDTDNNYQLIYRGPNSFHCKDGGNVPIQVANLVLAASPYCINLDNEASSFQIGLDDGANQLQTSKIGSGFAGCTVTLFSGVNCNTKDAFGVLPPKNPGSTTLGTCYETNQPARSAVLSCGP